MKNKIFLIAIFLVIAGVLFIYNGSFLSASLTQPQEETQIRLPENKKIAKSNETTKSKKDNEKDTPKEENEVLGLEKINEMEKEDLMQIDGIGDITAKKILEAKEIETREDLTEIDGIGEATTEKIEEYVSSWDENSQNNKSDKNSEEEQNEFKGETESAVTLTEKELEVIFRAMKKSEINSEEKELKDKKNVLASESKKESQPEEIDLNKANSKQLQKLIGIGPAYASRIINARPFCSVDELVKVNGIGDTTIKNIKDQGLAVASCSNSNQDNNYDKTKTNKNLDTEIKEKKDEIEELREEIEKLEEENEELNEENEELEQEIDNLEDNLEDSRDRLNDERNNDKNLNEKLKTARVKRDACEFDNQININVANKDQLKEVDGVGDSISEDILNFASDSPITYFEQLKEIDGVGPAIVGNFIDSDFCAEDPIIDNDNDGDNSNGNDGDSSSDSRDDDDDSSDDGGNGSSEVNEYNVSFKETNDLEDVNIKLYDNEDQSNPIKTITTNNNGEVEQELEEDDYWFIANQEDYEDYTGSFSLAEDKEIHFELTPIPQTQNLLKDSSFSDWELEAQAEVNQNDLLSIGAHSYTGPYREYVPFTTQEEDKEVEYTMKVKLKGTGYVQLGLLRPGYSNSDYQDEWTKLDSESWTELTYTTSKEEGKLGTSGEFVIRHTSNGEEAGYSEDREVDIKVEEVYLESKPIINNSS